MPILDSTLSLIENILTIESIPVADLSPERVARWIIMQLDYFRNIHGDKLSHEDSITKITGDIPCLKKMYFLGRERVKVSTQSYS